mgnify:CR=1 FL=1
MIRVLLADDHEIVRLGLRSVLEGAEDIDVVGEVATAEAAVSAAQAGGIDVILMDLRFGAAKVVAWAPYNQLVGNTFLNDNTFTGSGGSSGVRPAARSRSRSPASPAQAGPSTSPRAGSALASRTPGASRPGSMPPTVSCSPTRPPAWARPV